jgi:hypothetical protein
MSDADDLFDEMISDLKSHRLPLFGHKEMVLFKALCRGIVRLIDQARESAVREAWADLLRELQRLEVKRRE